MNTVKIMVMGLGILIGTPLKATVDPRDYWKAITGATAVVCLGVGYWLHGESAADRANRLKREQEEEAKKRKENATVEFRKMRKDFQCELTIAKERALTKEEIQQLVDGYTHDNGLSHTNCSNDLKLHRKKLATLLSDLPEKREKIEETQELLKKIQRGHGALFKQEIIAEVKIKKEFDLQDARTAAHAAEKAAVEKIASQATVSLVATEARNAALLEAVRSEYTHKGVTALSNQLNEVHQDVHDIQRGQRALRTESRKNLAVLLDGVAQSNQGKLTKEDLKKLEKRIDTVDESLVNLVVAVDDNSNNQQSFPLSGGEPSAPSAQYFGYPKAY